jgi:hypothetical protein
LELEAKSRSEVYSDINRVFNIPRQIRQLNSRVEKSTSAQQIINLVNEEVTASGEAFKEFKTYTTDIENLYIQYVRIRKYHEGKAGVPSSIDPEHPLKRETPFHSPEPVDSPEKRPDIPSPTPSSVNKKPPVKTTVQQGKGQMEPDFAFSSGFPYIGQVVYFKANTGMQKTASKDIMWTMNGTKAGYGENFSYRFKKQGKYTLVLTVYDKSGKAKKMSRNFIAAKQDLNFTYGWKPQFPNRGEKIDFFFRELSGGIPPYDIKWSLDSVKAGTGKTGEAEMPDARDALLLVTVTDARGCIKTASTVIATQSSPIDYRFWWSNPTPVQGQTVRFAVLDLKGGSPPYKILWKMDGKSIGSGEKIRYSFESTGEHLLEVEVTDSKDNRLSGEKKFDIRVKPVNTNE